MSSRSAYAAFVLALALGCVRPQVLATSRLVLSTAARQADPEVTETPTLRQQRGRVLFVALQAPDYCAHETVAETTGQSENNTGGSGNTAVILETFCGVQMGEIERSLSQAGYVVANWRALRTYLHGRSDLTPLQYAQRIGAQVLLQVNSLERVEARASRDGRWERRYDEADHQGRAVRERPLRSADRRALRELLSTQEEAALDSTPLGVTLDVNAVFVANGQTVWFYRWTKVAEDQRQRTVRLLAEQMGPGVWMSLAFPETSEDDQELASEMEALSASQRNTNRDRAVLFRQAREVITDFTQRFVQGVGVASGAPQGELRVVETPSAAPPPAAPAEPAPPATTPGAPAPAPAPTPPAEAPVPPSLSAGAPPAAPPPAEAPRRRRRRRDE